MIPDIYSTLRQIVATPRLETDADHTVMLGIVACVPRIRFHKVMDEGKLCAFAALAKIGEQFGVALPWVTATIEQYDRLNTPEARFIKTLDKVLPKITHALDKGAALREHGVQPGDIDAINGAQYAKIVASYGADQPEALALYQSVHGYLKSVLG